MKNTYIKPLAVALLLGVLPLTISSAYAVKGDSGLKSDSGFKGDKGESGVGLIGPMGPQGIKGDAGVKGDPGQPGAPGLKGDKGEDAPMHIIGEQYQGGIIFWVDTSGQHGLIAAKADQSAGVQWYNGTYFQTNATADGIYAGAKNTEIIIATQTTLGLICGGDQVSRDTTDACNTILPGETQAPTGVYAALIAANYEAQGNGTTPCSGAVTETCYGDWYLPSKFELNKWILSKKDDPSTPPQEMEYWSSNDFEGGEAWAQMLYVYPQGGSAINQINETKSAADYIAVRAVRAF